MDTLSSSGSKVSYLCAVAAFLALTGCGGGGSGSQPPPPPPPEVTSVTVSPATIPIQTGASQLFTARVRRAMRENSTDFSFCPFVLLFFCSHRINDSEASVCRLKRLRSTWADKAARLVHIPRGLSSLSGSAARSSQCRSGSWQGRKSTW
jgi:hypothetical protein